MAKNPLPSIFSEHPSFTDWLDTGRQEGNKEGKEDKRLWSISSNIKKL